MPCQSVCAAIAEKADEGRWVCRAEQGCGNARQLVTVSVLDA